MDNIFKMDPDRIQVQDDTKYPTQYWRVSYSMPVGKDLVRTLTKDYYKTAEVAKYNSMWGMISEFDERVEQIKTNHERLTWIAATSKMEINHE